MDRNARAFDFVQDIAIETDPGWLATALQRAANGLFPSPDRSVRLTPRCPGAKAAVLAFTAHHVIASDLSPETVMDQLRTREVQLPTDPRFLTWLAEELGGSASEDTIDVVLARAGSAAAPRHRMVAPDADALADPRVAFAAATRTDIRVFRSPDADAVVVVGRGLADRLEVSVELDPRRRGSGLVAELLEAALSEAGPEESLFAQVSAGNSAALRVAMRVGFRPICAEYLVR
jgi:GNAT superfamily N-acetyltransferase